MSNDNTKEPQLIFKAELIDNKVETIRNSSHIGILSLISKKLDYEITELIAQEKVKKEFKKKPIIVQAPHNIINKIRGGKG